MRDDVYSYICERERWVLRDDDDDVYYYIRWRLRLKLEGRVREGGFY